MIVRTMSVRRISSGPNGEPDRIGIELPSAVAEYLGWQRGQRLILTVPSGATELRIRREDYDVDDAPSRDDA